MARSTLDNPQGAAFAWDRYRRMMRGWAWAALAIIAIVVVSLWTYFGLESIHLYIASSLAAGLTVMMTGALMGLMFLSSGTGHDEAVVEPLEIEKRPSGQPRA